MPRHRRKAAEQAKQQPAGAKSPRLRLLVQPRSLIAWGFPHVGSTHPLPFRLNLRLVTSARHRCDRIGFLHVRGPPSDNSFQALSFAIAAAMMVHLNFSSLPTVACALAAAAGAGDNTMRRVQLSHCESDIFTPPEPWFVRGQGPNLFDRGL